MLVSTSAGPRPRRGHRRRGVDEAIHVLERTRFDIVLCDYRLGPNTGLDLLRAVRGIGIDIPFILLTGVNDRSVDCAALEAGAADFVAKEALCITSTWGTSL